MRIEIKNMVCDRCIKTVNEIFSKSGFDVIAVSLGEVEVEGDSNADIAALDQQLRAEGFEIIFDQELKLVNKMKSLIIDAIHHKGYDLEKMSSYLSEKLNKPYPKLSTAFSKIQNKTVEQFTIEHKIEKAKELLSYKDRSISEISYELNYSSPQHFSRQFKKITGFTPTQYLQLKGRKKLDKI